MTPQNKLERSLVQAATDPAYRPQFYRDLVESDIFIIQHGSRFTEIKETITESDFQLKVQPIEYNGKQCLPAFSSLPRLQAVIKEQVSYIALNALVFLKATRGANLILNPGSDCAKEFGPDEVASLLDGSLWKPTEPQVTPENTKVLIGQPAKYPSELVDALCRLFAQNTQVEEAYLAHFFNPKRDEKPHTLIALEVVGDYDAIVAEAGIVVKEVRVPDPPVNFVQLRCNGLVESYFASGVKPFYQRKLFSLI
jgi:hypothetical protein